MAPNSQADGPQVDATGSPEWQAKLDERLASLVGEGPEDDQEPEEEVEAVPEGEDAPPEEAPDESDEPEADDQPEDEPEAPADEAGEQAAPEGEEETDDDADLSPEHQKALRGLRLLHAPETVLRGLSEAEAIKWWNSRKKAETAINRQVAESNKQGATPTTDSGAQGVPTAAVEQVAPSEAEAAVLARIGDEYGPELRDAVAELVELKTAPLRQTVQEAAQRTQAQLIEAARAKAGERFPGLMDDERWSAVQGTARYLSQNPKFLAIEKERGTEAAFVAVFEAAARAEGVREVDEQALARRRKVNAARRVGTPKPVATKPVREAPKTYEERVDLTIKLIEKGLSQREIQAQLGG